MFEKVAIKLITKSVVELVLSITKGLEYPRNIVMTSKFGIDGKDITYENIMGDRNIDDIHNFIDTIIVKLIDDNTKVISYYSVDLVYINITGVKICLHIITQETILERYISNIDGIYNIIDITIN